MTEPDDGSGIRGRGWVWCLLVLASLSVPFAAACRDGLDLNQFEIQMARLSVGDLSATEIFETFVMGSAWRGLNALRPRWVLPPLNLHDPDGALSFVLARLPRRAVVLPSQHYFYFRILDRGRWYRGNLNLAAVDRGEVQLYLAPDKEAPGDRYESLWHNFSSADRLRVRRVNDDVYELRYRRWKRTFRVESWSLRRRPDLLAGEELVTSLLDDSGLPFLLLYCRPLAAFFYVLDESHEVAETFVEEEGGLLRGVRTGFVFLDVPELDRRLLIGVRRREIDANTSLDGPFDQVPGTLRLRDRLHAAYPYTRVGAGIDSGGRFLAVERARFRVAIAPYAKYSTLAEMSRTVESCRSASRDQPVMWRCLTFEETQADLWPEPTRMHD